MSAQERCRRSLPADGRGECLLGFADLALSVGDSAEFLIRITRVRADARSGPCRRWSDGRRSWRTAPADRTGRWWRRRSAGAADGRWHSGRGWLSRSLPARAGEGGGGHAALAGVARVRVSRSRTICDRCSWPRLRGRTCSGGNPVRVHPWCRRRPPVEVAAVSKQPPLAHLGSAAALRAQAPPTWGRRWPGPDRHHKELATPERCRAYARLAEEVARSRTVAAEMALFLASGLLGATLPHYFDRNRWWELGAVGAVTGLGAGLRLRFLARDWQRRAAYFHQRASSHDQRPADGVPATAAAP